MALLGIVSVSREIIGEPTSLMKLKLFRKTFGKKLLFGESMFLIFIPLVEAYGRLHGWLQG